jgi:hypothetical protein
VCFQGNTFPSNAMLRPRSFADVLDTGGRPLGGSRAQAAALGREECLGAGVACPAGRGTRRCRLQAAEVLDLLAAEGQRCAVHYLLCWARTISSTAL